jgi:hypothetical protein
MPITVLVLMVNTSQMLVYINKLGILARTKKVQVMSQQIIGTFLPLAAAGIIVMLLFRSAQKEEAWYDGYIIPWYDYVRIGLKMAAVIALALAFALVGITFLKVGTLQALSNSVTGQELIACALFAAGLSIACLALKFVWSIPRCILARLYEWREQA